MSLMHAVALLAFFGQGVPAPTVSTPQSFVPALVSPQEGAVVDNGCTNRKNGNTWRFQWSEVPGAERYHLYVKADHALNPVADERNLKEAVYVHREAGAYVVDCNRHGWKWKVRAMVDGVWGAWSEERGFEVELVNTDCQRGSSRDRKVDPALATPALVAPSADAVFDHFPRTTKLEWAEVADARGYLVEVDYGATDGTSWASEKNQAMYVRRAVRATSFTLDFVGAQPGRWRVSTIGPNGTKSSASEWRHFRYTR
jgi:hypothetical protein